MPLPPWANVPGINAPLVNPGPISTPMPITPPHQFSPEMLAWKNARPNPRGMLPDAYNAAFMTWLNNRPDNPNFPRRVGAIPTFPGGGGPGGGGPGQTPTPTPTPTSTARGFFSPAPSWNVPNLTGPSIGGWGRSVRPGSDGLSSGGGPGGRPGSGGSTPTPPFGGILPGTTDFRFPNYSQTWAFPQDIFGKLYKV